MKKKCCTRDEKMEKAILATTLKDGSVYRKEFKVPKKRYNLGIIKQRDKYVSVGWFKVNPVNIPTGYGKDNFIIKDFVLPASCVGHARLIIGKRVISKSK